MRSAWRSPRWRVSGRADDLHPLQETFLEEQAAQCGFCTAGMIIAAQGLLNRVRYPRLTTTSARRFRRISVVAASTIAFGGRLSCASVVPIGRRYMKSSIRRRLDADASPRATSPSLDTHPQLDDWIQFNEDRTVTVYSGKVELGQGIRTALAQIAADELDIALERIRLVTADTDRSPDEGSTAGSRSLETSGVAIRIAAAEARMVLLSLAFEQLDALTPADGLKVSRWRHH